MQCWEMLTHIVAHIIRLLDSAEQDRGKGGDKTQVLFAEEQPRPQCKWLWLERKLKGVSSSLRLPNCGVGET